MKSRFDLGDRERVTNRGSIISWSESGGVMGRNAPFLMNVSNRSSLIGLLRLSGALFSVTSTTSASSAVSVPLSQYLSSALNLVSVWALQSQILSVRL
ncbi:hypothetical protein RRG08_018987 [Elysia crispata]|uniref:Uncharacterized protein n=1 Tax=Elysia crispata TaxID=231223 RepID=A0AAE1A6H7_9GAST|nr:hypothetical protein RRG08_018987 [Elysia crispata]